MRPVGLCLVLEGEALVQRVVSLDVVAEVEAVCNDNKHDTFTCVKGQSLYIKLDPFL